MQDHYKRFEVKVALNELIDNDLEGFLDLLADLVGNPLLMDITYHILSVEDDVITFEVWGDDSERDKEAT